MAINAPALTRALTPRIQSDAMQTVAALNETFGIPERLTFAEPHPGMVCARIATPACQAELYLHGAHLTQWQPAGSAPVLFLSERSAYTPQKAIRGGIPIIFPWFGDAAKSPVATPAGASAHGFARTASWTLRFAALAGDDLHLSLLLDAEITQQAPGFSDLQLALDVTLGTELHIRLTVARAAAQDGSGAQPTILEEALHTYLAAGDISQVQIEGLGNTEYLDKPDDFKRKTQTAPTLVFEGEVDRPYVNTTAAITLVDPVLQRRLMVTKENSQTTVVWNPAAELTAKLADMPPDAWQHFACIETANAGENALHLLPGQAHTMGMRLSVLPL